MSEEEILVPTIYKEPLLKTPDGFGYLGTLSQTKDGKYVQCHICGKLFEHLAAHVSHAHKMKAVEYREKFQLSYGTAMASEQYRIDRRNQYLKYLRSLSEEERLELKRKLQEKSRQARPKKAPQPEKHRLETKNRRGTCPDQLIEKIKEVADKLGHTPSKLEFNQFLGTQKYTHAIYATFGSWTKALEMAGHTAKTTTNKGNKRGGKGYSREELLELLVVFAQEYNKIPTFTDFRGGLLPSYEAYTHHFGTLENARRESGVYSFIEPEEPTTLINGTTIMRKDMSYKFAQLP